MHCLSTQHNDRNVDECVCEGLLCDVNFLVLTARKRYLDMNFTIASVALSSIFNNSPVFAKNSVAGTGIRYSFSFPTLFFVRESLFVKHSSFSRVLSSIGIIKGRDEIKQATVEFKSSTFSDITTVNNNGGALMISSSTVTIDRCSFINITCYKTGGAIYITDSNMTLTLTCFLLCQSLSYSDNTGGNAYEASNTNCFLKQVTAHKSSKEPSNKADSVFWMNYGLQQLNTLNVTNCYGYNGISAGNFGWSSTESYEKFVNVIQSYDSYVIGGWWGTVSFDYMNLINCSDSKSVKLMFNERFTAYISHMNVYGCCKAFSYSTFSGSITESYADYNYHTNLKSTSSVLTYPISVGVNCVQGTYEFTANKERMNLFLLALFLFLE